MPAVSRVRVMLLALGLLLSACGSTPIEPVATTPTATASRAAGTPTPTAAPPTPTACSPLADIDAWPPARRAAQLVAAPALDGQAAALTASISQGVGGILLLGSAPADLRQQLVRAGASAATPLLVMADQEGGGVQRLGSLVDSLPWPRQMAATMTPAAVQAAAARVGAQMKALGVAMDLAPVLDLDAGAGPSDGDPDGMRSFSADPTTATTYGVAFARGLQQAGVIPVVKHFPGLGGASGNTELGAASTTTLAQLQRGALLPFVRAVADGLPAVMVSHATIPGTTTGPASLSPAAITGVLRQQVGFHGLVLTDSLSAGAVSAAGYDVPGAAVAAITAGADLLLFGSTLTATQTRLLSPSAVATTVKAIVDALTTAVQSGRLPAARLDDAVLHVLTAKGVDPCR
jgi:beta-N-acetylhexosaminidase